MILVTRNKHLLISLLLFLALLLAKPLHATPVQKSTHEAPQEITYSRILLAAFFLELFIASNIFTENNDALKKFMQQLSPKNLCINFLQEYLHHFLTTFFHESGHALTAKFVNDDPCDIHLGANSNTDNEPLASIGAVSLDGLCPTAGYSTCTSLLDTSQEIQVKMLQLLPEYLKKQNKILKELSPEELLNILKEIQQCPEMQDFIKTLSNKDTQSSKAKLAAILLAGGLAGIIGHHLTKMGAEFVQNCWNNHGQSFWQNCAAAGKQALVPDNITIYQLFNMFMPFSISEKHHSDASKLYLKCLGASPEVIQALSKTAIPLHVSAELALMYHQHAQNNSLVNLFLLTLFNYQLRGYLHFEI